jgi:hypothetical protein
VFTWVVLAMQNYDYKKNCADEHGPRPARRHCRLRPSVPRHWSDKTWTQLQTSRVGRQT